MKKILIGMLITCTLGIVACGKTNTENSSMNDNSNPGVTDGATEGMDGTDYTDNTPGTMINDGMEESKRNVENLYNELKGKIEGGVDTIKEDDWDKYRSEFNGEIDNIRNNIKDMSLQSTVDDIQNLFDEYDNAVKEKVDVSKEKIEEMKNKIENSLK